MSDLFPAYIVRGEAWYAGALGDRDPGISVMLASTGGGVAWEFTIDQIRDIAVQVQVFSDAWQAFTEFPALFVALADLGDGASLDDVRALLDAQGFKDITERVVTVALREPNERNHR